MLPPRTVVEIPLNGLPDAVCEFRFGKPAQLVVYFGRVDGIAHIVTLSVGNKGYKAFWFAESMAYQFYDVDILHLVVTADVVHFANRSVMYDKVDRTAVILNVQPVANVFACALNGQRFVSERICDHKRNQLLWKVIRSVVVRAA